MEFNSTTSTTQGPQQAMAADKDNVEDSVGKRLGIAVISTILVGATSNFFLFYLSLAFNIITTVLGYFLTRCCLKPRVKKWPRLR